MPTAGPDLVQENKGSVQIGYCTFMHVEVYSLKSTPSNAILNP